MSTNTKNLGLFKYDPDTDGSQTFNIEQALNNNWDKIDESVTAARKEAKDYSDKQREETDKEISQKVSILIGKTAPTKGPVLWFNTGARPGPEPELVE